uniref:Uncharacterized protein n=1 Tax=Rhizophora mucronata TaxID=61149 RepID=A0A2P2M4Y3_RHIMU
MMHFQNLVEEGTHQCQGQGEGGWLKDALGELQAIQMKQVAQELAEHKELGLQLGQSQRVVGHYLEVEFEVEWVVLTIHQLLELLHIAWAQDGEHDSVIYLEADPSGKMVMLQKMEAAGHQSLKISLAETWQK